MIEEREEQYIEEENDLLKILNIIRSHLILIIFTTFVITIATGVYLYFSPYIYEADSTIEISEEKNVSGPSDLLMNILGTPSTNLDTEIEIVKSRFVINRALNHVDMEHRIFGVKNFKKRELYKNSPFQFILKKGFGVKFKIKDIKNDRFLLIAKGRDKITREKFEIKGRYQFGDEIKTKYFDIIIKKKPVHELKYDEYRFYVLSRLDAIRDIQDRLSVGPPNKRANKINIIVISYKDNVPLRAKEITNAIAKAYLSQSLERKTLEASLTLDFIDKQLSNLTKNLKSSEEKLAMFKSSNQLVDIDTEAGVIINKISDLETQISELKIESSIINNILGLIKS